MIQLSIREAVLNAIQSLNSKLLDSDNSRIICHSQWCLIFMESIIQEPSFLGQISSIELLSPSTGYDVEFEYDLKRTECVNWKLKPYLHEWGFVVGEHFLEEISAKKEQNIFFKFISTLIKNNYIWSLKIVYCPLDPVINAESQWEKPQDILLSSLDLVISSKSILMFHFVSTIPDRCFNYSIWIVSWWHNLLTDFGVSESYYDNRTLLQRCLYRLKEYLFFRSLGIITKS